MLTKNTFNFNIIFAPLLLICFFVFAIGFSNIENYTYWFRTLIILIISGVAMANIFYMILGLFIKNISSYKNSNNIGIRSLLIASFLFLSIGGGLKINERYDRSKNCKNYVIYQKAENHRKGKNYYIFIKNNGKKERLSISGSLYDSHLVGQKVNLCVTTGYLGFVYIKPKD